MMSFNVVSGDCSNFFFYCLKTGNFPERKNRNDWLSAGFYLIKGKKNITVNGILSLQKLQNDFYN